MAVCERESEIVRMSCECGVYDGEGIIEDLDDHIYMRKHAQTVMVSASLHSHGCACVRVRAIVRVQGIFATIEPCSNSTSATTAKQAAIIPTLGGVPQPPAPLPQRLPDQ